MTKIKPTYQELEKEIEILKKLLLNKKDIELSLIETEGKFNEIANQATDGIALAEMDGNYVFVNQKFCEMTGYSSAELLKMSVFDLNAKSQPHIFNESKTNLQGSPLEVILQRKDNTQFCTEIIGKVVKINNKDFVLGTVRDITERKRAEGILKENEEKYRMLFNANRDSITILTINPDGMPSNFIEANDASSDILGYPNQELMNLSIKNLLIDVPDEIIKDRIKAIKILGKLDFEVIIKDKLGIHRNTEVSAILINYKNKPALMNIARDITKRKQAELELRKLKIAVDQSPVTIAITNSMGEIEYINPSFTATTGYSFEEAKGINPRILKSGKTNEAVYLDLWSTISSGKTWQGEFINKKKNGAFYTEEAIISPVLNEQNEITDYIAVKTDISGRKQAEEELIKAKENTEKSERNLKERIKELNGIYSLGLLTEQFENHEDVFNEFVKIVVPESMQFPDKVYVSLEIDNKKYCNIEDFKLLKRRKYLSAPIYILGKQRGELIVAYTQDIKFIDIFEQRLINAYAERISIILERIKSRKELQEAKEKAEESDQLNKTLLKTIPFGMDIVDESGNIIFQSENLQHIFGERVFSTKCWELYRDDKKQCSDCPLHSGIKLGETNIYQSHGVLGGKIFEIIHTGMIYMGKKAMLEIFMDVTERKKSELIIQQQNQELKELNADKDRFISILAHDLKSPFNSILGFLNLLIKKIRNYDIEKIEKQLHIINNSAQKTYKLLEDILMWARAQSGKIPYEPKILDFTIICNDIIDNMKLAATNKNIAIKYLSSEICHVNADENMLKTILRNLVSNAIKFTSDNGQINVGAKQVQNSILVSISDNGVGMSPETLSKLFGISHEVTIKGTKNETGTGLGLLLCKEFVEKHDGKIWAESELGKGSTFYFTI